MHIEATQSAKEGNTLGADEQRIVLDQFAKVVLADQFHVETRLIACLHKFLNCLFIGRRMRLVRIYQDGEIILLLVGTNIALSFEVLLNRFSQQRLILLRNFIQT